MFQIRYRCNDGEKERRGAEAQRRRKTKRIKGFPFPAGPLERGAGLLDRGAGLLDRGAGPLDRGAAPLERGAGRRNILPEILIEELLLWNEEQVFLIEEQLLWNEEQVAGIFSPRS
jgi:hypothetical protein